MAGQADLKKLLTGGGSGFYYLASGNTINMRDGAGGVVAASWGNSINVTDLNIDSPTLVNVMDVNVPSGELLVLITGTISDLGTTSHDFYLELEVDGVTVATATQLSSTTSSWTWLGVSSTGDHQNLANMITNIEVRNNFKLKARKTGTSGAVVDAFVRYAKLLRS